MKDLKEFEGRLLKLAGSVFKTEFSKLSQMAPLGAITKIQEAMSSKGATEKS